LFGDFYQLQSSRSQRTTAVHTTTPRWPVVSSCTRASTEPWYWTRSCAGMVSNQLREVAGQKRMALSQPAYLIDNGQIQTRKKQIEFRRLANGKRITVSSTASASRINSYQGIHRQQTHHLNQMPGRLILYPMTRNMCNATLQGQRIGHIRASGTPSPDRIREHYTVNLCI
jgi:hypothetical protein